MKARFAELGGVPMPLAPAEFSKLIADETDTWARVIRTRKLKAGVNGALRAFSTVLPAPRARGDPSPIAEQTLSCVRRGRNATQLLGKVCA